MSLFPLGFWDLSLWLAAVAIILLATSGMLSQIQGGTKICINKKRLKNVSIIASLFFLATVIVRIITIILIR
jgi:hypothetical protein